MSGFAVVIPVDGDIRQVEWPESDTDHLTTMYREIGCSTVELVNLRDFGLHMWADEEGLFKHEPRLNYRASALAQRQIVGTVLLTAYSEGPKSPGLSTDAATKLREMFGG